MADVTLPPLPVSGEDPWFDKRDNFDKAVKAQLEGPLSESELGKTISQKILEDGLAIQGILNPGETPTKPGIWARRVI